MKYYLPIIILLPVYLCSCNKSAVDDLKKDDSSIIIKAGYMCGWGSGEDSMIITSRMIKYVYSVPGRSPVPVINKRRLTTASEWNNLLNSINTSDFFIQNYNSCNICVDGCDEWIYVKNNSISHQIRFGLGLRIDSIIELQNILGQLRDEFRN